MSLQFAEGHKLTTRSDFSEAESPHQASISPHSWLSAVALTTLLSAAYLTTLPRTLTDTDAGEFATIAVHGGIAHAPGYPLYTMLIRIIGSLVPATEVVWWLAAFSAICTILASVVIHRTMTRSGVNAWIAGSACLVAFLTKSVWRNATNIEPFALNFLQAALVCHVALRLLEGKDRWKWQVLLGVLFGTGFANHHTLALLIPLGIVALWNSFHPTRSFVQTCVRFGAGFLAGATPLVYFWFALNAPSGGNEFILGRWNGGFASSLIHHLLRRDFGTFQLAPYSTASGLENFDLFLKSVIPELTVLWTIPMLIGFMTIFRRSRRDLFRRTNVTDQDKGSSQAEPSPKPTAGDRLNIGVVLTLVVIGTVFLGTINIDVEAGGIHRVIVERFLGLPLVLLAFPMAIGLAALARSPLLRPATQGLVFAMLLGAHVAFQYIVSDRSSERFYDQHIRNILNTVEPNGVIFTFGDPDIFGILFAQRVLGLRPDVVQVPMAALTSKHVAARVARDLRMNPDQEEITPVSTIERAEKLQRPIYLVMVSPTGNDRYVRQSAPVGPIVRFFPDDSEIPFLDAVLAVNIKLFDSVLQLPSIGSGLMGEWEVGQLSGYGRTLMTLHNTAVNLGDPELIQITEARKKSFDEMYEEKTRLLKLTRLELW